MHPWTVPKWNLTKLLASNNLDFVLSIFWSLASYHSWSHLSIHLLMMVHSQPSWSRIQLLLFLPDVSSFFFEGTGSSFMLWKCWCPYFPCNFQSLTGLTCLRDSLTNSSDSYAILSGKCGRFWTSIIASPVTGASSGKVGQSRSDVKLRDIRKKCLQKPQQTVLPPPQLTMQGDELLNRVDGIEEGVEEVTEKIYELDKSWKNNLVFYGVKCDDGEQSFQFGVLVTHWVSLPNSRHWRAPVRDREQDPRRHPQEHAHPQGDQHIEGEEGLQRPQRQGVQANHRLFRQVGGTMKMMVDIAWSKIPTITHSTYLWIFEGYIFKMWRVYELKSFPYN